MEVVARPKISQQVNAVWPTKIKLHFKLEKGNLCEKRFFFFNGHDNTG